MILFLDYLSVYQLFNRMLGLIELNAYTYYNRDWNQILSDGKVKALKHPLGQLKRNEEYKTKEMISIPSLLN
jgi:hypothetical protein